MANFEYKIHLSIDESGLRDNVKGELTKIAKEFKNNAFKIELTGDPKKLIQQLVELKKQVPDLDLTKGITFDLADAIKDDSEQSKKIINELTTYIINSVTNAVNSIDSISGSIQKTMNDLDSLKKRKKDLLADDGSADVVSAFEKAQERLKKASDKFADSKQNKNRLAAAEEMRQAYRDILNYQTEAGKEMSEQTKQILGVFAQDVDKTFKDITGKEHTLKDFLSDVKVDSSYKKDLQAIESQIFETENKLTQLKKDLESAQNPELQVKGKLADNFLEDLQSQLDKMTGLEVKVKPKVDKDVKLEVEVEEDVKPIDSPNNSNNSSEIEEKKQEIKEISHDLEDVQQHINNIKPQKTQDEIRMEFEKTRNTVDQTVSSQGNYFESLFEKAKTAKLSYEEVIAVVSEAEKISSQFTKHNLELQDTDFSWADGDWEKYDIGFQGLKSDMDNFKQSLSDTYKLYKNVESAIKNNAGMYKGQFYDNSDLDNLRGIFQNIASYADELGIDINSVIESIPRMTKEFKGLAVDAVLQQKNITENNRQYDGESEELKNINSQLQERYRLLEKILTITTKDNIGKTVDIEDALSSGSLSDFTDKDFQYGNVQTIVENICKLLGIEIPSAAEKAKEAINETTSAPSNTSAMDTVEEELREEAQAHHENAEAAKADAKAQEEFNNSQHGDQNNLLSDVTEGSTKGIISDIDKVIDKCNELKEVDPHARVTAISSSMIKIKEVFSDKDFNEDNLTDKQLIKIANAFDVIEKATDSEAKEMASGVKDYISQLLSKFGIEIKDLTGSDFNSLFKVDRFVGEGRTNGNQGIIAKQSQPYIFRNNKLLKNPNIIVDDGGINEDFIDNVFNEYSHAITTLKNKGFNSEQIAQVLFGNIKTSEVVSILESKLPIDEIIQQLIDKIGIKGTDGTLALNGMIFPSGYDFKKDRDEFLSNETPVSTEGTSSSISQLEKEAGLRQENVQLTDAQIEAELKRQSEATNKTTPLTGDEAIVRYIDELDQMYEKEKLTGEELEKLFATSRNADAGSALELLSSELEKASDVLYPEDLSGNLDKVIGKFKELGISITDIRKLLQGDKTSISWVGTNGDRQENISKAIELLKQLGLEVESVNNPDKFSTTITARTQAQVEAFHQEKQAAEEVKEVVEELVIDLDELANHPFPTDDIFANQKIAAEQSLRRLDDMLPEGYDGQVKQQISDLHIELSQLTEDDGLSTWASKFKIVADNVKDVNNEVKSLKNNLKDDKLNYSLSLDKSLKIKDLDKYSAKLKELGLYSDETADRVAELYEKLGSVEDKNDLSIYNKELKLLQSELAEQVNIRQRNIDANKEVDPVKRKIDLLKQQYDYEIKLAGLNKDDKAYSIYNTELGKVQKSINKIKLTQEQEAYVTEQTAQRRIAAEAAFANAKKKQSADLERENNKQLRSDEQTERKRTALLKRLSNLMLNGQIMKNSGNKIRNYFDIVQSEGGRSIDTLNRIEKKINDIEITAKSTGKTGQTMFQMLQQRWQSLAAYLGSFASFYKIIDYARRAVTVVKEFDDALTEMRKVSDESVSTLKAFQQESFEIAAQVGSTAKVIQDSTADWMRLGRVKAYAPLYSNIY